MSVDPTRLLTGVGEPTASLATHEARFAALPVVRDLLGALEAAGLRGRGGAAFPTHVKARLVRDARAHSRRVVINAMEGEPAAHKDQTLLAINPHLVLDGAEALAHAIGADEVTVCVARENAATVNHVGRAVHERESRRRGVRFELRTPPGRYIAGEESALVHWLNGNETLPQYRPARPSILRVGRSPALVDNAETLANVALIARRGPQWFRDLGTRAHPGTALVSVSGAVRRPVVVEVALGTPLRQVLAAAAADESVRALLLGGYGGAWVDGRHLDVAYDNEALGSIGATVGAGVIVVLPRNGCGVTETAHIARWMANESARQCGPCAFGLPAMAADLDVLATSRPGAPAALRELRERSVVVAGRGACRHPDGVVRMIGSALEVFADDVSAHVQGRPCSFAGHSRFATVPRMELEHELVWE